VSTPWGFLWRVNHDARRSTSRTSRRRSQRLWSTRVEPAMRPTPRRNGAVMDRRAMPRAGGTP